MKFQFRNLQVPPLPQLSPTRLTNLAAGIDTEISLSPPQFPDGILDLTIRPPRSLDEIFKDLEQGEVENISLLEWVYCIYTKEEWDRQHQELRLVTAEKIWEIAYFEPSLQQRLLWLLALYYNGDRKVFASSFAETFSGFAKTHRDENLTVTVLLALRNRQAELKIIALSWQQLLTPKELFELTQLPTFLPLIADSLDYATHQFIKAQEFDSQQVEWLLRCFEQMTTQQQVSAVEELLSNIDPEVTDNFPQLISWLQENYHPHTTGSKWHQLSSSIRKLICQLLGIEN